MNKKAIKTNVCWFFKEEENVISNRKCEKRKREKGEEERGIKCGDGGGRSKS